MTETWFPNAIRRPGPAWKTGYTGVPSRTLAEMEGEVKHDAGGSLAGAFAVLDGPRQASWTFTDAKDGRMFQHYPLEAITWHAGLPGDRRTDTSLIGNLVLIGIEHEGVAGEPLTQAQLASTIALSHWIRRVCPLVGSRPPALKVNLWEHRWLTATSCPSGRIPWNAIIAALSLTPAPPVEEDDMFDEADRKMLNDVWARLAAQETAIKRTLAALGWRWVKRGTELGIYRLDDDALGRVVRRHVPNPATLTALGGHLVATRSLPPAVFDLIPEGPPLPDLEPQ